MAYQMRRLRQRRCCWFKITEQQSKAVVDRAQARLSNSSPEPYQSKTCLRLSSVSRVFENEGSQAPPSKQKPEDYGHGLGYVISALAFLSWRNVSILLHPLGPEGTLPFTNVFLDPLSSRLSVRWSQVLTLPLHSGHLMVAQALFPEGQACFTLIFVTQHGALAKKGTALSPNLSGSCPACT